VDHRPTSEMREVVVPKTCCPPPASRLLIGFVSFAATSSFSVVGGLMTVMASTSASRAVIAHGAGWLTAKLAGVANGDWKLNGDPRSAYWGGPEVAARRSERRF
jgi:hypothetical protein